MIARCPECGFCSTEITNADGIDEGWLKSEEYRCIISKGDEPVIRYEAFAYLLSKMHDHSYSARILMRAARLSDDDEKKEESLYYRNKCVEQLRLLDGNLDGNDALMLVEALRCAERFEEASAEVRNLLNNHRYIDKHDSLLAQSIYIEDHDDTPNPSAFGIWM